MKFAVIVARPAMFAPCAHKRTTLHIEYYKHAVDAYKAAQRERERELIFRGEQIRSAIDRYRRALPERSEWPKTLDDLVEDRRTDEPRHHLRRRFEDPFGLPWGEIRDTAGGLIGVYSRSELPPIRSISSRKRA